MIVASKLVANSYRLRERMPGEFYVQLFGTHEGVWTSRKHVVRYSFVDKFKTFNAPQEADLDPVSTFESLTMDQQVDLLQSAAHVLESGRNGRVENYEASFHMDVYHRAVIEANIAYTQTNRSFGKMVNGELKLAKNFFIFVTKQVPYKNTPTAKRASVYHQDCGCKSTDENPCSEGSQCLNRLSFTECEAGCHGGPTCQNRRFIARKHPNCIIRKIRFKGLGLVTKEEIKKGTFVGEYTGELITRQELDSRLKKAKDSMFYYFTLGDNILVDARPKGNHTRYMNHSCDPNCFTQKWSVKGSTRIGIMALRDIEPDEELTFDYNLDNTNPFGQDNCRCGSDNCVARLNQDDSVVVEKKKPHKPRGRNVVQLQKSRSIKVIILNEDPFCQKCLRFSIHYLIKCANCVRAYCKECTGCEDPVEGVWKCPSHVCQFKCSSLNLQSCNFCANSYCWNHRQYLLSTPTYNLNCCQDHSVESIEEDFVKKMTERNLAIKNAPKDDQIISVRFVHKNVLEFTYSDQSIKSMEIPSFSAMFRSNKDADQTKMESLMLSSTRKTRRSEAHASTSANNEVQTDPTNSLEQSDLNNTS